MTFSEFFKVFIKLFPPLLIAMLGAAHSSMEVRHLIDHTTVLVFGFKYDPTLWTCFVTLFVTITAFSIAVLIMFKIGKSYKKNL